jgi:hypothetical protein
MSRKNDEMKRKDLKRKEEKRNQGSSTGEILPQSAQPSKAFGVTQRNTKYAVFINTDFYTIYPAFLCIIDLEFLQKAINIGLDFLQKAINIGLDFLHLQYVYLKKHRFRFT